MPSTKTPPQPTLTVETIQPWRTLEDCPTLRELAQQRRTLREQRTLLLAREKAHLTLLAQAHTEKRGRLAAMHEDVSAFPPFDPSLVNDAVLQECRAQLMTALDALLQAEDAWQEHAEPVIREFSALQKSRMVTLMDEALTALDTLEQVGIEGEALCMQSFGCTGSYITNIALYQRMQRRDRAVLQAERDRLNRETEVYYG